MGIAFFFTRDFLGGGGGGRRETLPAWPAYKVEGELNVSAKRDRWSLVRNRILLPRPLSARSLLGRVWLCNANLILTHVPINKNCLFWF